LLISVLQKQSQQKGAEFDPISRGGPPRSAPPSRKFLRPAYPTERNRDRPVSPIESRRMFLALRASSIRSSARRSAMENKRGSSTSVAIAATASTAWSNSALKGLIPSANESHADTENTLRAATRSNYFLCSARQRDRPRQALNHLRDFRREVSWRMRRPSIRLASHHR
jgi:hypothetical protein